MKAKKVIIALLVFIIVAAVAVGFVATKFILDEMKIPAAPAQPVQTAELPVEPVPEPTVEPTATPAPTAKEIYSGILSAYYAAAAQQKNAETLTNDGLNYMTAYAYAGDGLSHIGYYIADIDGNGTEELLIGSLTGDKYTDNIIIDMYTIKNNIPEKVFSSGERDRYYLTSDRMFVNEGSSSAYLSTYNCYNYSSGELKLVNGILFDMAKDRNSPWFSVSVSGEAVPMSEADALTKTAELGEKYISIAYTPFSSYIA